MRNFLSFVLGTSLFFGLQSCGKKKLQEIVEVPLPTKEEKITIGNPDDVRADEGAFNLTKLPFQYNELEPDIAGITMEMHYSKHYLSYTNKLNKIVAADNNLKDFTIREILEKLDLNQTELRNNAGGYYNHTFYFEGMTPNAAKQPKDTLASKIQKDFGSFASFKNQFIYNATTQFGSGWTWLVLDKTGKLQITNTPNQDNPLMPKQPVMGTPLLALDLWEHAFYLDYQYRRRLYIDHFFNVINWKKVGERFEDAIAKK
jgi:superoxide dismutase, Fe-Mn family